MLKIQRVKVENFCNIPLVDFEFPDGLTVVLGPNGSGKSSFLNAIYSAFTGNFDRGPGDAAGCIRQNQDGKTYTEVYGTVLDRPFRIRRDVRFQTGGKTVGIGHALWLDGNRKKESESKTEIAGWIESTTGLTREMMQEYLFIGQYDFIDYFSRRASERWKKFSALCGTKSYEKRFEDFAKLLNVDKSGYEKATVSVSFLQDSIRETENVSARIRTELEQARSETDMSVSLQRLLADQDTARGTLRMLENLKSTLEHLAREKGNVRTNLVQCESALETSEKKIEAGRHEITKLAEEMETSRREIAELLGGTAFEEEIERLDEIVKSNARRELLEKEIRETQNRLDRIPDPAATDTEKNLKLRDEFDTLIRRIGNFEADLRTIRPLIETLGKLETPREDNENGRCPLCGSESMHWMRNLNNMEETRDHLEKELAGCESLRAELEIRLAEIARQEKRNAAIRAERLEIDGRLDRLRNDLETCPESDSRAGEKLKLLNDNDRSLREKTIRRDREEKTIAFETETRNKYQSDADFLRNKSVSIESEMDQALSEAGGLDLGDLEPIREEIRKREARIEAVRDQEKRIAALEGKQSESRRQVERLREQFDRQCRMRDNFASANVWFEKCGRALRWLHKDGLPRLIHASVLKDLVQVINFELKQYNDPFWVSVNEDLTFRVHFPDGTQGVSTSISGGQRYLLVLSFLMAMNRTFAQNLGIMFLDEPTAFLDEENIVFLTKILEQLKRILRRRGQQLVIVTHVDHLAVIADTVYSLANPPQATFGGDRSEKSKRLPLST